jgi:hypothetical protein
MKKKIMTSGDYTLTMIQDDKVTTRSAQKKKIMTSGDYTLTMIQDDKVTRSYGLIS